jgi:hypothetical protein
MVGAERPMKATREKAVRNAFRTARRLESQFEDRRASVSSPFLFQGDRDPYRTKTLSCQSLRFCNDIAKYLQG